MNARQCAANTVSIRRNEDEVNVVGHQHPAPDLYAGGMTLMSQEIAIERIVIIAKEGLRPPVAALIAINRLAGISLLKARLGRTLLARPRGLCL
jgi:hypothetical protein